MYKIQFRTKNNTNDLFFQEIELKISNKTKQTVAHCLCSANSMLFCGQIIG